MSSVNKTGRSKGDGRYINIYHALLNTPAWEQMTPLGKAAFIECMRFFNGSNNGRIAISSRSLADKLGVGKSTAARAIEELLSRGFLRLSKASDFSKKRLASEYRFTHLVCNKTGSLPSKEFMTYGKSSVQTTKSTTSKEHPLDGILYVSHQRDYAEWQQAPYRPVCGTIANLLSHQRDYVGLSRAYASHQWDYGGHYLGLWNGTMTCMKSSK